MATVLQAPRLERMTQEFVDPPTAGGGRPLYELSPAVANDVLTNVQFVKQVGL